MESEEKAAKSCTAELAARKPAPQGAEEGGESPPFFTGEASKSYMMENPQESQWFCSALRIGVAAMMKLA
ncbi:hypothetical protein Y1Q_0004025 [Alligator mississippiensis]|uniref:Uncharacterized protein n=1 Tax=Alligator mississippiensis TaxID=8496 RepID=A0A151PHM0_ALLMI|nr:hypothetical protein Y1Q_0004025 [Alligator mississippiensis]